MGSGSSRSRMFSTSSWVILFVIIFVIILAVVLAILLPTLLPPNRK